MKRIVFFRVIGLIMSITASESVAKAGLISVSGGQIMSPTTLGPYTITPFSDDLRPIGQQYTFVTSPLGGNVTFSFPMIHDEIMPGWSSWSNDYQGDVYWTGPGNHFAVLKMPSETCAFYFYAQPRYSDVHTISALAYDGISNICQISQEVHFYSGAGYYGFYCTEGSVIDTITIYCNTTDFAIGEFGISMLPAPGAILLGAIGVGIVGCLRRKRQLL